MVRPSPLRHASPCLAWVGLLCMLPALAAPGEILSALSAELQSRSDALSVSTDPDDARLKKATNKVIAAIDSSPGDLAGDLKAASKALKGIEKAYADELATNGALAALVDDAISAFRGEIQGLLDGLDADLVAAGGGDAFAKVETLIAGLVLVLESEGCFVVEANAPCGPDVRILSRDEPLEVTRRSKKRFAIWGIFTLSGDDPKDAIAKVRLVSARVYSEGSVEGMISGFLYFVLFPVGLIVPQTIVVEGKRAPLGEEGHPVTDGGRGGPSASVSG